MRHRGKICIVLGVCLIIGAMFLMIYNEKSSVRAKNLDQEILSHLESQMSHSKNINEMSMPEQSLEIFREMPVETVDGVDYIGVLEIPVLGIKLPIAAQCNEDVLKIAPGRYAGSVYQKYMVIGGHNYRSHFGDLSHLNEGDRMIFTDIDGVRYGYETVGFEVVEGSDVSSMEDESWPLSLFTCTYGGQSRFVVRCQECPLE